MMANLENNPLFIGAAPRAESLMDKISRAAKEIIDEETEQRQVKTDRLRKARLEREKGTVGDANNEETTGLSE